MPSVKYYKANAIAIPTDLTRTGIDIPVQLDRLKRDKGRINDCAGTNFLVINILEYESSEQVESAYSDLKEPTEEIEVTEIRHISIDQIKQEMLSLQADGKTRYADEIAGILGLDIIDVIEAFSQLQEEGKLFVDNDKL